MNIIISWVVAISVVLILNKNRKYYAGLFVVVVSIYELAAITVYLFGDERYTNLYDHLVPGMTPDVVENHCILVALVLLALLAGIYSGSLVKTRIFPRVGFGVEENQLALSSGIIIFAFGLISLLSGGGEARIRQYAEGFGEVAITPFHFYMIVVSPIAWYYTVKALFERWRRLSLFMILSTVPALIDLFIAGRRQMFVPLVFFMFFFLLKDKIMSKGKKAAILVAGFLTLVVIFAIQFSFRYAAIANERGQEIAEIDSYVLDFVWPIMRELAGSGATTISAVRDFVVAENGATLGVESYVAYMSKAFPFVGESLSNYLMQDTTLLSYSFSKIAPFGALTTSAESLVFFGIPGAVVLSLFLGAFVAQVDKTIMANYLICEPNNHVDVLYFWIASALLFKYRSGLLDIFIFVIQLTFMAFFVLVGAYVVKYFRSILILAVKV